MLVFQLLKGRVHRLEKPRVVPDLRVILQKIGGMLTYIPILAGSYNRRIGLIMPNSFLDSLEVTAEFPCLHKRQEPEVGLRCRYRLIWLLWIGDANQRRQQGTVFFHYLRTKFPGLLPVITSRGSFSETSHRKTGSDFHQLIAYRHW